MRKRVSLIWFHWFFVLCPRAVMNQPRNLINREKADVIELTQFPRGNFWAQKLVQSRSNKWTSWNALQIWAINGINGLFAKKLMTFGLTSWLYLFKYFLPNDIIIRLILFFTSPFLRLCKTDSEVWIYKCETSFVLHQYKPK